MKKLIEDIMTVLSLCWRWVCHGYVWGNRPSSGAISLNAIDLPPILTFQTVGAW